jgi:hypothetical protein
MDNNTVKSQKCHVLQIFPNLLFAFIAFSLSQILQLEMARTYVSDKFSKIEKNAVIG